MKLRDRRYSLVFNYIRESLMDSDKDVGVMIDTEALKVSVKALWPKISDEEFSYGIIQLIEKGYLAYYPEGSYIFNQISITQKGIDEWLFAMGVTDPKKIFLSYAIEDNELAGKIKLGLESDFNIFLAHEDITPGAEWLDMIISNLHTSAIFLALRTVNYEKKSATEQECGFALALGKRIIPICIGTEPDKMGFCSPIQGKRFDEKPDPSALIVEYCRKQLQ
jgi:hypothetical protein